VVFADLEFEKFLDTPDGRTAALLPPYLCQYGRHAYWEDDGATNMHPIV
jgi:hypothetical protein